jgi:hypothetical protein
MQFLACDDGELIHLALGRYQWFSFSKVVMKLRVPIFYFWRDSPQWARVSTFTRFPDHTRLRTTFGRSPLDDWSVRRRDLDLATHNRQTDMPLAGLETTISARQLPQTYALDRAATGTGFGSIAGGNFSTNCATCERLYSIQLVHQMYMTIWK